MFPARSLAKQGTPRMVFPVRGVFGVLRGLCALFQPERVPDRGRTDRVLLAGAGLRRRICAPHRRAPLAVPFMRLSDGADGARAQHDDVRRQGQRHDHRLSATFRADGSADPHPGRVAFQRPQRSLLRAGAGLYHAGAAERLSADPSAGAAGRRVLFPQAEKRCADGCAVLPWLPCADPGRAVQPAGHRLSRQHAGRGRGPAHDPAVQRPPAGAGASGWRDPGVSGHAGRRERLAEHLPPVGL